MSRRRSEPDTRDPDKSERCGSYSQLRDFPESHSFTSICKVIGGGPRNVWPGAQSRNLCVPLTGASTAGRPLVPQFATKLGNTVGILPVLDGVGHRRYLTRPNPRTVMKVGFGSHTREVGGHHLFPPLCIRRPSPRRLRLCFVTRHALRTGIRNFCRGLPGELASHRPSPARTIRGPERLAGGRDPKPALAPIPKRQC